MNRAALLKQMESYPPFYKKVWTVCLEIPAGQTRTYSWIAQKVGSPKAARAVGQALAKNPFAPTVPCHRVVCVSGALGGYSGPGGLTQKKKMLAEEKSNSSLKNYP